MRFRFNPRLGILACVLASVLVSGQATHATDAEQRIGYLGPAGSWTHQACIDLFGEKPLVPFSHEQMFADYAAGKIDKACVPVTTSVVGPTPYLDEVLKIPNLQVVAEYPRMLSYSMLVKPGTKFGDIKEIIAHPVALQEVKPWIDREMPQVKRTEAVSGGGAAEAVAHSTTHDMASMGPAIGASLYGLSILVDGIEKGPHNVTRWWVLGHSMPAPTGHDKTSLLVETSDEMLGNLLRSFGTAKVQILTVYERPSKRTLDTHRYLIEVAGHSKVPPLSTYLANHRDIQVLGSYPRKY